MSQRLEVVDPTIAPPVWAALRNEAYAQAKSEAALASLIAAVILNHDTLGDALSYQLARKLGDQELRAMSLRDTIEEAFEANPRIVETAELDLKAVFERDPACKGYVQPFLFFKGFLALQTQRVAHWLWHEGRETLAFYLQSRMSELFQVDIHPATQIGRGVFIDHGTGIVIGETAVIGDDVSMLQNVTLGGTGAEQGGPGRTARRRGQGAGQHHHRRLRQGGLRLSCSAERTGRLHRRRRTGAPGKLPRWRGTGQEHGPHPR
jgi:serine O-acetyltransferase